MSKKLKQLLEKTFDFHLNQNQFFNLQRLFWEIKRKKGFSQNKLLQHLKQKKVKKSSPGKRFDKIKDILLKERFPQTIANGSFNHKQVFLNKLKPPLENNIKTTKKFTPSKIVVESWVRSSQLLGNFKKHFPKVEIEVISKLNQYLKKNKFSFPQLKQPVIFIIKQPADFIKPCPCTKYHLCCGYWVFNLGFGCPFDCSYCYLQQYSNIGGIILPANLEDFFKEFDIFYKKLKKPVRIGTGEFCDSLTLDHITGYSKKLISYFRDKNVLFELKTKSNNVENLLKIKSSPNIIISWSLNPSSIIKTEELSTATLTQRLNAALKVQENGYQIAFHFDPIIYSENFKKSYQTTIAKLYSKATPPFAWISLGTLRSNPKVKTAWEMRFPKSNIFYQEMFLGKDNKLRYPDFIKVKIYKEIIDSIKKYDKKTPIYLCMESENIWNQLKGLVNSQKIEKSLIY